MIHAIRHALSALFLFTICALSSTAAAEVSKEACLESHSRGQDAREDGKLSLARKLFMTCAQPACPSLVQNDCARYADDLERAQPWLSFAARDADGRDLPDTAVYVDDVLVVTRLDDGKPHEVDPGRHVVRFVYAGREQVVTLVVGSGEKGRVVASTFASPAAGEPGPGTLKEADEPRHAVGARVVLGTSAALLLGGGVLGVVGLVRVPAGCSVSSHECASPPGDPSFKEAEKAVRLSNIGWTLGGVGALGVAAGLVWYFRSAKLDQQGTQLAPVVTSSSLGLALSGRL